MKISLRTLSRPRLLAMAGIIVVAALAGAGGLYYRSLPKFTVTIGNTKEIILPDNDVDSVRKEITGRLVPLAMNLAVEQDSPVFKVERRYTPPMNWPEDFQNAAKSSGMKFAGKVE